ncbi:MAG: multidrug effflux MFS transporter [Legionella sp.]|nr:multidrug effflux MFS transporter [Legionella sp.]
MLKTLENMHIKKTRVFYLGFLSSFPLITFDLYQPALPAITTYFNTSHALGQLTLSLFFFIFGFSQIIWGPLIDHYGRARLLNLGFYLYMIATIGCLFATSIETLIAARALQGFAVCCANIVAFSSSRDIEDSTERARLLSHISMIVSVSPLFAPLIGSVIFVYFGWRATFLFMAVIGIILFFLSGAFLVESPYWVKSHQRWQLAHSLRTYRELLTHKRLWAAIYIITFSYSCIMIIVVNAAYVVIDNLGISPTLFAVLFASNGVFMIIGNFWGIRLRKHRSLPWNIRFGSAVMVISSLCMLILYYYNGLTLITLSLIEGVNLGVALTNSPTLSLALADYQQQAGSATAILNTVRMTLSAIIGGIVGALLVYSMSILPISLFLCSLICFMMSFKINDIPLSPATVKNA